MNDLFEEYIDRERFTDFVLYHKQGDAGVEARILSRIADRLGLFGYKRFELVYCYQATYHIPSALKLYEKRDTPRNELKFRTDRRYLRCLGAFEQNIACLTLKNYEVIESCVSTTEAFNKCVNLPHFGRYSTSMFLENYIACGGGEAWIDDFRYKWEPDENYTKGALLLMKKPDRDKLDNLFNRLKEATSDNSFALETSLCALEKIRKGTRWNGYYTERAVYDALGSEYEELILGAL